MLFNRYLFRFSALRNLIKHIVFGPKQKDVFKIKFGIGSDLLMYGDFYSNCQKIFGTYEMEVRKYFRDFAKRCEYFFDIGAADGYYSLIYRKYNKQGKIFFCDPALGKSLIAKKNFVLNGFGLKDIYFEDTRWISDITDEGHIRIDDMINESDKTYFFKIDVEGAELHVLKGGKEQLMKNRCFFIIETHSLPLEKTCFDFLNELHYNCKVVRSSLLRILLPELRHTRCTWLVATKA